MRRKYKVGETCRSLSSFSVTKALIWKTKENMAIARKNVGPAAPTAEKS